MPHGLQVCCKIAAKQMPVCLTNSLVTIHHAATLPCSVKLCLNDLHLAALLDHRLLR